MGKPSLARLQAYSDGSIRTNYGGGVGVCPVSLFTIIQTPDRFVNIFVDKDFSYHFLGIGKKVEMRGRLLD